MSPNALAPPSSLSGDYTASPGFSPTPTLACDANDMKNKFDSPTAADDTTTTGQHHHEPALPIAKTLSNKLNEMEKDTSSPVPKMSQRKKWSLLAVFSLGMFIDIWYVESHPCSKSVADAQDVQCFLCVYRPNLDRL
jgi:hypothetical protein